MDEFLFIILFIVSIFAGWGLMDIITEFVI